MPATVSIAEDYARGRRPVSDWLPVPWSTPSALLAHADRLVAHAWPRAGLVELLAQDTAAHGRDRMHCRALGLLEQPECLAVVTGQQPAYGGGPLYTLHKVAHAIALAQSLSTAGRPAVAVFWCASEDHDAGEADHADLVADDGRLHRLRIVLDRPGASTRHQPAAAGWTELVACCRDLFGAGLGGEWLQSQAPLAGEGLGAWLCRLLTALFAGSPLLCVEAHRLRPLWTQRRTVICQAWPAAALEGRRQAVIAAGHSDALGAVPVPPLFRDSPAGRSPLPDASRTPCPPEELSSGAALRPVIQQAVLPAAVAVLGPGELGYHALLGPAYEALAVPMPAFVPRQGGALVDARLQRACRRWGVDPAGLRVDTPAPALPAPAHGVDLAELDAAIAALDRAEEGVQGARLRSGVVRLRRERDRLAASLERGRRQAVGLPPFGSIRERLFPRRRPQERVLSLSQAIWRYGPGIAAHLIAAADADQPHRRRVLPI